MTFGTAFRLRADYCSMGQETFNVQNGSGAHPLQVPLGYPDVWFLINPSAQMLGRYLNIILASAKRFQSGRFHEFLFTSPQLYRPYKKAAENCWLLCFNSRAFFQNTIHHSHSSFDAVQRTYIVVPVVKQRKRHVTFCSNIDMFKLRLQQSSFTEF
jgi:hypothetical protein